MAAFQVSRDQLVKSVKELPSAPQILARVGEALEDLDSNLDEIAELIRLDGAITVRLIKVANSAAYNTREPFSSLEEALARLGLNQAYRLVGLAAMRQFSDQQLAAYGVTGHLLRENSLLTALIMEFMVSGGRHCQNAAYTAGLLRSTGKIALDRVMQGKILEGRWIQGDLASAERELLGIDSCEATAVAMGEWRFPKKTIESIRAHYDPPANDGLANVLNLASGAADAAGFGLPGEARYWELTPAKLEAAGVTEDGMKRAVDQGLKRFEVVREAVA
jgi:HD-like signal output (HDOD) protein